MTKILGSKRIIAIVIVSFLVAMPTSAFAICTSKVKFVNKTNRVVGVDAMGTLRGSDRQAKLKDDFAIIVSAGKTETKKILFARKPKNSFKVWIWVDGFKGDPRLKEGTSKVTGKALDTLEFHSNSARCKDGHTIVID